jgi:hypothetical protein
MEPSLSHFIAWDSIQIHDQIGALHGKRFAKK